jgi:hypothetical protein
MLSDGQTRIEPAPAHFTGDFEYLAYLRRQNGRAVEAIRQAERAYAESLELLVRIAAGVEA